MKENKKIQYRPVHFIFNNGLVCFAELIICAQERIEIYADNVQSTHERYRYVAVKRKYSLTYKGAEKKLVKLYKKMNKKYPILRGENE